MKSKLKILINNDLAKIILTSILTAIFSFLTSYFLLFNQLKGEQQYWKQRALTGQLIDQLEKQMGAFETFNKEILKNEVLTRDFKLFSAKYKSKLELAKHFQEPIPEQDERIMEEKGLALHLSVNELAAKIQMCEVFFGVKVDSLISPLNSALNENFKRNLIFGDSVRLDNIENISKYFDRDFETSRELSEKRIEILKAMREEIDSLSDLLYSYVLKLEK